MAYAKKMVKKGYKKVVRPYVKRKGGYNNRMKLYKEVQAIKKMINAEKKYVEGNHNGVGIGQLFNGADGIYCASITPTIAVGAGYNNRTGISVKCSGLYFRGQFVAQANTINMLRIKMTILRVNGAPQTTANIISGMYDPDSLTAMRDYNASRNPNQFQDYKVITERRMILYPDSITGQQSNYNFNIPLKLTHHIRWNTSGTIQEGELFMIIRADNGDGGTPVTGAFFSCSQRLTYYDN